MKTNYTTPIEGGIEQGSPVLPGSIRFVGWDYGNSVVQQTTAGFWQIGDDVITKDSLFVIIVEIDTRIYKTYP